MSNKQTSPNDSGTNQYTGLDSSAESSTTPSRRGSVGADQSGSQARRGRVRFNSTSEANDAANKKSSIPLRDRSLSPSTLMPPKKIKTSSLHSRSNSNATLQRRTPDIEKEDPFSDHAAIHPVLKPRPSVKTNLGSNVTGDSEDVDDDNEKAFSALAAQERAQRIASLVGSHSAPTSARTSLDEDEASPTLGYGRPGPYPVRFDDIPLAEMDSKRVYDETDDESDEDLATKKPKVSSTAEAHKLVRTHTRKNSPRDLQTEPLSHGLVSGQATPIEDREFDDYYVPKPQQYRGGVLSSLLKLYNAPGGGSRPQSRRGSIDSQGSPLTGTTPSMGSSGTSTPRSKHPKWYSHKNQSQDTLGGLIEASAILGAPAGPNVPRKKGPIRPDMGKRTHSGKRIESAVRSFTGRPRLEDEIRITVHIAETLTRQKYLLKLCRALMEYGAPTHRLEEYMKMSARVLEIEGQFLYIPGCMIISFDDASTHTTEVKLVKSVQGVDLGRLKDVHEIYKEVVHDVIGVEEATQRLDIIMRATPKHNQWLRVIVYGLASASVAPFAFQGRLIDLPVAFLLGSILGFLQLIVAPKSELYSNVFEISAAVFTSFLARAFGSIRGGNVFCFSALAQSAIALILPGYMVLCGSLELQSRSMVAGSVRMVYAIIYSLFLGFGITIGTAFYSLFDSNATSATKCSNPITPYYRWFFVPAFTLCLTVINQAKWKQTPVMIFIAFVGYVVNFFTARKFPSSPQISNTLGAFAVGVLGNLYSRMRHGVAAAALLPAIFVQVPSGLAASGSLLAGLSSADEITNSSTYANGTTRVNLNGTSSVPVTSSTDLKTIVVNVGYSMIEVAIGITVGLFLSALVVYPFGKRRSGLFSF